MIPTFPNLPTDNLYKFMAITGFFTYVICIGFITFDNYDWRVQQEYVISIQEEIEKDISLAEKLTENAQEKALAFDQGMSESDKPSSESSISDYEKAKELINSAKEKTKKLESRLIPMRAQMDSVIHRQAIKGKNLGFWLGLLGFVLWMVRIQRYQDKNLRLSKDKYEIELEIAKLELIDKKKFNNDPTP